MLQCMRQFAHLWPPQSAACVQQLSTGIAWAAGAQRLVPPSSIRELSNVSIPAVRALQGFKQPLPCSSRPPLSIPPGGSPSSRQLHLAPPFLVEDYVPAATTTYRQVPPLFCRA
jgi:hypothetical protein